MPIELGTCGDCGATAERQTDTGRWWHRWVTANDCTSDFYPARFRQYVEDGKPHWRWCHPCDVKWWGGPVCWSCAQDAGAYASLSGPSHDGASARWVDDGGTP